MIIRYTLLLLGLSLAPPSVSAQTDQTAIVRRIAATVQLAAEEYALGVQGGRVVAREEVEEARLFLTEAKRSASALALPGGSEVRTRIDRVLDLVAASAPGDSVSMAVGAVVSDLASRYGIAVDDVPDRTPSLARGAAVYQAQCSRCHGALGRGDGADSRSLSPLPANLRDTALLAGASPLAFYRRVTIGVAGTAMPAFEQVLPREDRWAVALYASTLRLPPPQGTAPPSLTTFATTARLSDAQLLAALGEGSTLAGVSAVRALVDGGPAVQGRSAAAVFDSVRRTVASAVALAKNGRAEEARQAAFDAYLVFEQVERDVRARDAALAGEAEKAFAALRDAAAGGGSAVAVAQADLDGVLERSERLLDARLSPLSLFLQSFILLVREGLEAILVVGALMTFLVKTGAGHRKRDIHVGVGAAIGASLVTAFLLETVFRLGPARQEVLEGFTMVAAALMLFYVSYWLLNKVEVAKWNAFVKAKVQDAVSSGSALAIASVAFLAVYREGFETVLFYKALMVSGGPGDLIPILTGMAAGGLVLAVVYVAINRFGVRLPLKPFFAVTSSFLYYMAFVFAGKSVAELQEGGIVSTTTVSWAPRIPALGIYPTVESLLAQSVLVLFALVAVFWIFVMAPARARRNARPPARPDDRDLARSLERIDADLAEARAELERVRDRLGAGQTGGRANGQ